MSKTVSVSIYDVNRVKQRSDADRWSPEGERRSPSEDEADEKMSSAEIYNAEDHKEIFHPKNVLRRFTDGCTVLFLFKFPSMLLF